MAIFTAPMSFQSAKGVRSAAVHFSRRYLSSDGASQIIQAGSGAHSSHPSFFHLVLLVFEAVLEVICVSFPGYIAARQGLFDADAQKLVANLNVALFTPCLGTNSFLFFPAWRCLRSNEYLVFSFHEIGISTDRREADRSRHYSSHLRHPDTGFISVLQSRIPMSSIPEETIKLCGGHGCESLRWILGPDINLTASSV
jgi:hypothetical protein